MEAVMLDTYRCSEKKKNMKKIALVLCILVSIWGLTACGKQQADPENLFPVYYLSSTGAKLELHEHEMESETLEEQIKELLIYLQTNPTNLKFRAPLAMGFQLIDYKVEAGKLLLNVSKEYETLTVPQEVLVRAAVVKTLTQLPQVNFVAFTVEGVPLTDALGKNVGWMNKDQFLENEGSEINSYETIVLKLYFANGEGNGLLETTRTKEYDGNIPLEKLIIEELIKGPNGEGIYPTINPQTKVASVTIQDKICYVNLDENFLAQVPNVTPEATIYSIANSLIEQLRNVNKVQISVNGDSKINYREKMPLDVYYERNLNIVLNND